MSNGPVCSECEYHIEKWVCNEDFHYCKYHLIKDHVTGKTWPSNCYDNNSKEQCQTFKRKTIKMPKVIKQEVPEPPKSCGSVLAPVIQESILSR